eukprot:gnl/Hemi2/11836_TR4059_c0_g2_i1.p1 gnl/Hemi2/11836_TR4059_c0_g2~~gnl/Hemi2/11836_TR4059_c0_g2_i1.p1  ORF type:complete len:163 (+),score=33.68 gnl/Hemi2/11836_TR4059_c0_g2_i1:1000-1488(+)
MQHFMQTRPPAFDVLQAQHAQLRGDYDVALTQLEQARHSAELAQQYSVENQELRQQVEEARQVFQHIQKLLIQKEADIDARWGLAKSVVAQSSLQFEDAESYTNAVTFVMYLESQEPHELHQLAEQLSKSAKAFAWGDQPFFQKKAEDHLRLVQTFMAVRHV